MRVYLPTYRTRSRGPIGHRNDQSSFDILSPCFVYVVCARVTITLSAVEPRVYVRTCRTWHIEGTARYHYHCHRCLTDRTPPTDATVEEASGGCRRSGASDTLPRGTHFQLASCLACDARGSQHEYRFIRKNRGVTSNFKSRLINSACIPCTYVDVLGWF